VTIRSERATRVAQQLPFPDDPMLRDFFGQRGMPMPEMPRERRQAGLGSGVIVSPDGYVLTNNHVVEGAREIEVELSDNRTVSGKVVGTDAPSDLAVVKIDAKGLATLPFGDSDAVRVGDVVLAVGNPLGVGQTVTLGIVSAKGRATGLGDGSFEDFLQTDAPINQGNSGGALVNTRGELIGINSQILSPSGGNIGIGFAIPARMARNVMDQLVEGGSVRRGMLGVTVQPVTSELAASLGLAEPKGALVNEVRPDTPAERAGIERGDVIKSFNGVAVGDSNSLRNQVSQMQPGSKATVVIVRDGREQSLQVTLAELPSTQAAATRGEAGEDSGLGLSLRPVSPRERRGAEVSGLLVTDVDPDGKGADAGIQTGDVIREVNGQEVNAVAEFRSALKKSTGRPALVLLNRNGTNLFLTLNG
jgi:Do/DeqQ family serine protease